MVPNACNFLPFSLFFSPSSSSLLFPSSPFSPHLPHLTWTSVPQLNRQQETDRPGRCWGTWWSVEPITFRHPQQSWRSPRCFPANQYPSSSTSSCTTLRHTPPHLRNFPLSSIGGRSYSSTIWSAVKLPTSLLDEIFCYLLYGEFLHIRVSAVWCSLMNLNNVCHVIVIFFS